MNFNPFFWISPFCDGDKLSDPDMTWIELGDLPVKFYGYHVQIRGTINQELDISLGVQNVILK